VIPVEAINEASRRCLQRGIRILQGFRLGPTDRAHISALLFRMEPGGGTHWLDIGCGFGEPAALMQELRPDLHFTLINNNDFQLAQVPPHLDAYRVDMHAMPFEDGAFDGAMFLYALCHANGLLDALREAARVVRPGGRLFVFDYLRQHGDNTRTQAALGANFFRKDELRACMSATGWRADRVVLPPGDDTVFRTAFGDIELYEELFADLVPAIWTATRE
jgi:ubiquinone/menaquinone biosynthesis C-methylase UbiE